MEDRSGYRRARDIFLAVYRLDPAERERELDALCAGDAVLRRRIDELCREVDAQTALFDTSRSPVPYAAELLAEELPDSIGRYRVLREIGRGGMGVVYRAVQESPRRVVALKVIRRELALLGSLQRFRREAEILGAMQHRGIAHVFEAGTDERSGTPLPYMAMELVEGDKLTAFAHRRRLCARARVELLLEVCAAVHHAHQRGVIHRDLKPANVLVDGTAQPKVLDFGIARALESAAGTHELRTLAPIGTPAYMSPEQREGDSVVDVRSDVYSLGVLGFELLTGHLPREHREEAAARVALERCASSFGGLRGDLAAVFERALQPDRELRYESAFTFGQDLRRFLDGRPVVARGGSVGYLALKLARRHRKAFAAGALAALLASSVWTGCRAERGVEDVPPALVLEPEGPSQPPPGELARESRPRRRALPGAVRPGSVRTGARRGIGPETWIDRVVVVAGPEGGAAGSGPLQE